MALLTDTYKGRFAATTDPGVDTGHSLVLAYRKSAASGDTVDLRVQLRDAADTTTVKEWLLSDIPSTFTETALTLTSGEAAAITGSDYTTGLVFVLQREGDATATSGNNRSADVSWLYLSTPTVAAGVGTLPSLTGASTAERTVPSFTALSTSTLPAIQGASGATSSVPSFTASGAGILPALEGATGATAIVPSYTSLAVTLLPALSGSATAATTPPGAGAQTIAALPALVGAAAAQSQPPTFTAQTSATLPAFIGTAHVALDRAPAPALTVSVSVTPEFVIDTSASLSFTLEVTP